MKNAARYIGQGLFYLLFIAFIGYFSTEPSFTNMPADEALIKFTFQHPGERLLPCTEKTPQELAKLPPQKRFKMECPRERAPLQVEFTVDDRVVYQAKIPAKGLKKDLPSPIYMRFTVPAGTHRLHVGMSDNVHDQGFTYTADRTVELAPLQTLVIDFDEVTKQFTFK
jgi:hypothetical protein